MIAQPLLTTTGARRLYPMGCREVDIICDSGRENPDSSKLPTIRVLFEAGQVYQVDSRFDTTSASYSLLHIEDIEEYERLSCCSAKPSSVASSALPY